MFIIYLHYSPTSELNKPLQYSRGNWEENNRTVDRCILPFRPSSLVPGIPPCALHPGLPNNYLKPSMVAASVCLSPPSHPNFPSTQHNTTGMPMTPTLPHPENTPQLAGAAHGCGTCGLILKGDMDWAPENGVPSRQLRGALGTEGLQAH